MAEKQNTPEIRFEGFTDPWEQRKWSEYVSISTDMVDPRSGNYGNLPHVGPGNMESFTGRLYDNVNTVKDDALISGKFHFNPGDIIYGKINPQLGKYTYAQFEGLASADAYVLNGKNGLTQEFLFGILQTKAFFDYSVSVSMRSGMPKINRDELNAFEFLAPNESEQRAIGDILLKLDDLITLHQRKHDKLCTVKKSMLDKMFPKPGETEPEIRFKGFTDPWEQRKLGDVATIVGGGTPSTNNDAYWDGDIDWYSPAELGEQVYADRSVRRITQAGYDSCSATLLPAGKTILFTSRAGIGNTAILRRSACTNQGFQSLVVNDDTDVYFVYSMTDRIKKFAEQKASGSTFLEISGKGLAAGEFAFPSKDEQTAIGSMFKQLDHLITLHQRKLDLLKNTKKSLLDKMFV